MDCFYFILSNLKFCVHILQPSYFLKHHFSPLVFLNQKNSFPNRTPPLIVFIQFSKKINEIMEIFLLVSYHGCCWRFFFPKKLRMDRKNICKHFYYYKKDQTRLRTFSTHAQGFFCFVFFFIIDPVQNSSAIYYTHTHAHTHTLSLSYTHRQKQIPLHKQYTHKQMTHFLIV